MNFANKIKLTLAIFCCCGYCMSGWAQHVTVSVTDTTHVQDSLSRVDQQQQKLLQQKTQLEQKKDQLENNSSEIPGVPDSIQSKVNALNSFSKRTIYSEKHLNAIRDSIEMVIGMPLPRNINPRKEMSNEEMLDLINAKYPAHPQAPTSKEGIVNTGKDSLQTSARIPDLPGLKNFTLDPAVLQELAPLPGNVVKSKYLKSLDSLRRINLEAGKLKYKEKAVAATSKVSIIREKPTFRKRSYFEGVLSLITGKSLTIYQAAPALGYHFTDNFSLGAGPTVQVLASDRSLKFNAGIRAFTKIEFFKRQLYLQAEDAMNPWSPNDESFTLDKHNVLVGGGVLLSLKAPVTLNFSVMYRVNESKMLVSDILPLVFRIGISTVKIQK